MALKAKQIFFDMLEKYILDDYCKKFNVKNTSEVLRKYINDVRVVDGHNFYNKTLYLNDEEYQKTNKRYLEKCFILMLKDMYEF